MLKKSFVSVTSAEIVKVNIMSSISASSASCFEFKVSLKSIRLIHPQIKPCANLMKNDIQFKLAQLTHGSQVVHLCFEFGSIDFALGKSLF